MEQWTHKPLDVGSNPTLATQQKHPYGCFLFKVKDVPLRKSYPRHSKNILLGVFFIVKMPLGGFTRRTHPTATTVN